jgi:hypothetical protein
MSCPAHACFRFAPARREAKGRVFYAWQVCGFWSAGAGFRLPGVIVYHSVECDLRAAPATSIRLSLEMGDILSG